MSQDVHTLERFVQGLMSHISGPDRQAGLRNDHEQFGQVDSLKLEKITVPTLIVHATTDTDVDYENGEFAARAIPGTGFLSIPEDTHICAFAGTRAVEIQERVLTLIQRSGSATDSASSGTSPQRSST